MSKRIVFTIDDTPVGADRQSPNFVKIAAFLDAAPLGQLFTRRTLCHHAGVNVWTFANDVTHSPHVKPYRIRQGTRHLYGHPDTIAAYAKEKRA